MCPATVFRCILRVLSRFQPKKLREFVSLRFSRNAENKFFDIAPRLSIVFIA